MIFFKPFYVLFYQIVLISYDRTIESLILQVTKLLRLNLLRVNKNELAPGYSKDLCLESGNGLVGIRSGGKNKNDSNKKAPQ
jgi:hypothetical protein